VDVAVNKKVAAAKKKVETADDDVAAAKKKVETAEEDVAAAKEKVKTAEEDVAATKTAEDATVDMKAVADENLLKADKNLLKAEKNSAKVVWDLAEAKRVFAMAMRDLVALDPSADGTTDWEAEVVHKTSDVVAVRAAYYELVNPSAVPGTLIDNVHV
jgi:chromosome segregation ATPase